VSDGARGNWGRWGPDDERGTANLLTPEAVCDALAVPSRGTIYQLGQPIQPSGQPRSAGGIGNQIISPIHLWMRTGLDHLAAPLAPDRTDFTVDFLACSVHGATTHIDALGHSLSDGELYNGFDATTSTSAGQTRCGIDKAGPLVCRGVLLDVAAAKGVDALPPDYAIDAAELQATAELQQVEVRPADAVLIRTGMYSVFERDPEAYARPHPGLGMDGAAFLAERDVVLVGADNRAVEPLPHHGSVALPVHRLLILDHGVHLVEFLFLEELAAAGVHEFLFVAAPLRITGGSGSPISPFAIA
jgi:kynurenine formamidase